MNKEELQKLREKTIESALPGILAGDAGDKQANFEMVIRMIQAGAARSNSVFNKAFELANGIEDENARMDALLRLLDEIDIALGGGNNAPTMPEIKNQATPTAEQTQ